MDPLQTVFAPYGYVQKLAIFEKNNVWQVRPLCCIFGLLHFVGAADQHSDCN